MKLKVRVKNEHRPTIEELMYTHPFKSEDEEDVDWEKAYKELLNEYMDIYVKLKELESFKESVKNLAEQTKQECLKEKAEKRISEEEIKDLLDTKISYIINSICTCIITPDNIGSKINFRYSIYDFIKYVVKYIDFFREENK